VVAWKREEGRKVMMDEVVVHDGREISKYCCRVERHFMWVERAEGTKPTEAIGLSQIRGTVLWVQPQVERGMKTERCYRPLTHRDEIDTGVCRQCRSGWEVDNNYPTEAGLATIARARETLGEQPECRAIIL